MINSGMRFISGGRGADDAMDGLLIHKLMNLVLPPIIFITLCITIPPYLLLKFFYFILGYFSMEEDMAGKVVLVTGASSGIGEQLVYEYARRGARLVLVARRKKLLEVVAEKARGFGSTDVLIVCADVSKVHDCKRFIEESINHFGRLDHLVNNAGITSVCPLEEATDILNFAPVMDVNFWGSIYATHFAIPHLRKSKGRIVASKAALINFYDSLRVELDPAIAITIASPGVTESEMTQGKHLGKEGVTQVDGKMMNHMIDTFLLAGAFPVISAELCAKTIVNGACKGKRSITEPSYFGVFYLCKVLCPEIAHWIFWCINSTKPVGSSSKEDIATGNKQS
ncbi:Short-chain dehydrogenase/reductase SDR [Macleaya cordata]|uniref:Short-chain dehydrogenase/reductase SDR n=1 Tax=Macleaya cordata TaxID=56857 RepID=A0A200QGQ5_MACCD|nr:Short-chain dehydrogenase/reductase SDR [Macleaya cordata]